VLAAIQDGLLVVDKDWRCTYANPAAAALLKTTLDRLLDRPIGEIWPPAQDARFQDEFTRAVAEGVFVRFEAFYRPAQRWYEYRCHPSPDGLTVLFCDATEHKQLEEALRESEQRFRDVLENSLDAAYRQDLRSNHYDYISPAVEQTTGFTRRRSMSSPHRARAHPDDGNASGNSIKPCRRNGHHRIPVPLQGRQLSLAGGHFVVRMTRRVSGVPHRQPATSPASSRRRTLCNSEGRFRRLFEADLMGFSSRSRTERSWTATTRW
jgi:PAS domain S-box-containing protein